MLSYDENIEIQRNLMLRKTEEADEDGFILVKPKNKRSLEVTSQASSQNVTAERSRKKRKAKELKQFYRHQINDMNKDKLISLRQKFEADKQKVAELKLQRKFKPF